MMRCTCAACPTATLSWVRCGLGGLAWGWACRGARRRRRGGAAVAPRPEAAQPARLPPCARQHLVLPTRPALPCLKACTLPTSPTLCTPGRQWMMRPRHGGWLRHRRCACALLHPKRRSLAPANVPRPCLPPWPLLRSATTVYLVQRRIDMLPKPLTEDICSLR